MRPHVVRQGDYLTRLAARMGFDADEVWNHDDNRELRERRPNREILAPGDILRVPDAPATSRPSFTSGGTRRYRARVPSVTVRVVLDGGQGPIANEPYEIHGLPGQEPLRGTTGADGLVSVELPVHVSRVDLVLPNRRQIHPLRVGHLDPAGERSGLRSRLAHLGYLLPHPGEVLSHPLLDDHGSLEAEPERLARAVRTFQQDRDLGTTGQPDAQTMDALATRHGS